MHVPVVLTCVGLKPFGTDAIGLESRRPTAVVTKWLRSWSSRRGALISCREAPISQTYVGFVYGGREKHSLALNAGRFRKHTRLKHSSADMLLYGSGSWRDVAQGARRSPKGAKLQFTSAYKTCSYKTCTYTCNIHMHNM